MTSIEVKVRPWRGGWELELDPNRVTQVRRLRDARKQIVDYLTTLDNAVSIGEEDIVLVPEIGARK